jgi:PAS domain S-box-containing protein
MNINKEQGSTKPEKDLPEFSSKKNSKVTTTADCNILVDHIPSGEDSLEAISLLNSTLNSIKEGILVVNLKGKIVFHNKKLLEIWNIPVELTGKKDEEAALEYFLSQLKNPAGFMKKVNELYTDPTAGSHDLLSFKDGRIIERFSQPQIFNNIVTGRVWSFYDLTDQVISRQSLINEKGLLQILLDNIPDTIYFKDRDSKFTLVNKAQARVLGISDPKDAAGKSDFDFFEMEHAAAAYEDEQNIMRSRIPLIAKVEKIRVAEGEHRWVTATKVPIVNQDGKCTGLVGLSRDITSTKLAEEKLENYSQELKELNASKDKLFSIIAHDLRSPFNPLLGLTEIIISDFDSLSKEELIDYNREIYKSVRNEYILLENLLNWSRFESGQLKFSPESINLHKKAESVITLLLETAKFKNITLSNETDKDTMVTADPDMLYSVLQNLIANAIKFTNKGGLIRTYSENAGNNFIQITVSDNGVGMTDDQKKNLFGFTTVSTKGTNEEKGTGLGLMICKDMVERHGGTICVHSEPGKGTDISFMLPVAE